MNDFESGEMTKILAARWIEARRKQMRSVILSSLNAGLLIGLTIRLASMHWRFTAAIIAAVATMQVIIAFRDVQFYRRIK
jgi:hypothetical protein